MVHQRIQRTLQLSNCPIPFVFVRMPMPVCAFAFHLVKVRPRLITKMSDSTYRVMFALMYDMLYCCAARI